VPRRGMLGRWAMIVEWGSFWMGRTSCPSGGVSEEDEFRREKGGSSAHALLTTAKVYVLGVKPTIYKRSIVLDGVLVGLVEPVSRVTALARALFMGGQFGRNARWWIRLIACRSSSRIARSILVAAK